jgi:membrane protease YdiL (CAAX protease family)
MQYAGWWADPYARYPYRYHDGWNWTSWVSDGSQTWFDGPAAPQIAPASSWEPPTFNRAASGWAVLLLVGIIVFTEIVGFTLWFAHVPDAVITFLTYAVLFVGMYRACSFCSTRWGTADLRADFGFSWRPHDITWGLLAWFVAAWVSANATAIVVAWIPGMTDSAQEYSDSIDAIGTGTFVVFGLTAVVAAPIIEELFFRGLLLRAFSARMHVAWAVTLQALVFGCYHLSLGLGLYNVAYAVSTAVFGFIMGWIAAWRRTLGVAMTAHAITNLVIFIAYSASR